MNSIHLLINRFRILTILCETLISCIVEDTYNSFRSMEQGGLLGGKLLGIGGRLMLRKLLAISVVLAAVGSASIAGSEPNIQDGNYEITTSMEMAGMKMGMEPVKYTQCLTKDDLIPQSSQQIEECKVSKTKMVGNTVTWIMKCHGHGGDTIGAGKITYSGNRFEGTIEMTSPQSEMKIINLISGQRIGDCK